MSYKKPYYTNSQKVDLFDINFEAGYLSKQIEIQHRLRLINATSKMAIYYRNLNDKQKEGEKKDMFAEFLDNVIALTKSNNQNVNYIIHNLDNVDFYQHQIKTLESDLRIKDVVISQKDRIIKAIQNEN